MATNVETKYTGPFHFVNKDASNLRKRDAQETFAIGSHVNGQFAKFMRQRRDKDRKKVSVRAVAYRPFLNKKEVRGAGKEVTKSTSPEDEDFLVGQIRQESWSDTTHSSASPETPERSSRRSPRQLKGQLNAQARVKSSAGTSFLRGNSDPFNASTQPITPLVNRLIQDAAQYRAGMIWPTEASMTPMSPMLSSWWQTIHDNLTQQSRYQISMALALAIRAQVDLANRTKLLDHSLRCKIRGLTALREQAADSPYTVSTLLAVMSLYSLGAYSYDPEALSHLHAAKRILDKLGGTKALDPMLREYLVTVDVNRSFWSLTPLVLTNIQQWDPGPLTYPLQRLLEDLQVDMSQSKLLVAPKLSTAIPIGPLRNVMNDLREVVLVEDAKFTTSDIAKLNDIFRWLHLRVNACRVRLLDFYLDHVAPFLPLIRTDEWSRVATNPQGDLLKTFNDDFLRNACVCISAITIMLLIMESPGGSKKRIYLPEILQQNLAVCLWRLQQSAKTDTDANLILWCTTVSALKEQICAINSKVAPGSKVEDIESAKAWCIDRPDTVRFINAAQRLNFNTTNQVADVMHQFLYSERVLNGSLTALCQNLPRATQWKTEQLNDKWLYEV